MQGLGLLKWTSSVRDICSKNEEGIKIKDIASVATFKQHWIKKSKIGKSSIQYSQVKICEYLNGT